MAVRPQPHELATRWSTRPERQQFSRFDGHPQLGPGVGGLQVGVQQLADPGQPVAHGVAMDVEFHRGILDMAVVTQVRAQRRDEPGVQRRKWLTKDFELPGAAPGEDDAERAQIPERAQLARRTAPVRPIAPG